MVTDESQDVIGPTTPLGHAASTTITAPTFGSSKNGNGAMTSQPTALVTKKPSPSTRASAS